MTLYTKDAARGRQLARCCRATEPELRRMYFAHGGTAAARYGVRFERLVEHLRAARSRHPHLAIPLVRHMDDLVQVVACVDNSDLAWSDLSDQHERGLVRACREWMEGTDAIVLVRRLFAELRRDMPGIQPLRRYDGTGPLRKWLGDRVIGRLNQIDGGFARPDERGAAFSQLSGGPRDSAEVRRRLADGHFLEGDVIWRPTPRAFAPPS